jgi:hypothetical protein
LVFNPEVTGMYKSMAKKWQHLSVHHHLAGLLYNKILKEQSLKTISNAALLMR